MLLTRGCGAAPGPAGCMLMPRRWVATAPGGRGDGKTGCFGVGLGAVISSSDSNSWMRGAVRVTLALAATAVLAGQNVHAAPILECSVDIECSTRDTYAVCDANHSICVCTQGRYREPPYKNIKCSVGKSYNEKCRSSRECLLADQYSDCIGGVCRCPPSYIPISVANNTLSLFRCMIDPFYLNGDHANLTFFKVSPVPLLVICIILVYLGYQRGAKVPQRRGSSTNSNRRIVPMWRGVTFHQTTPVSNGGSGSAGANGQTAVTPPRNSTSGSSGGGASGGSQTVVESGGGGGGPGSGGQRRESSGGTVAAGAAERDSRRGRGSAHSRRDSGARERQERVTTHPLNNNNNNTTTTTTTTTNNAGTHSTAHGSGGGQQHPHVHQQPNGISERRSSAMSPPPPYAEEAPPSYEDAIRASRVAMRSDEPLDNGVHNNNINANINSSTSSELPQISATGTGQVNNASSGPRNNQQQQPTTNNTMNVSGTSEAAVDASIIEPPLYSQACKRSSK